MDALLKTKRAKEGNSLNLVIEYPSHSCFTFDGVRVLSRYDILRTVARVVRQEENWLEVAFTGFPQQQKSLVTEALLDNWNVKGQYLVQSKGNTITSQELSALCCERYLTDEIITLLITKYCDDANDRLGRSIFAMRCLDTISNNCSPQFERQCRTEYSGNHI